MREQDPSSRRLSARFAPERPHPGPSGTNRDARRRRSSSPASIVTITTSSTSTTTASASPSARTTSARRLRPGDDRDPLSDDDSARDPCSDCDSLAVNMPSSLPSLSSDTASASSSTSSLSLDTLWASRLGGAILEDDGTGALVVPSRHDAHHHQPQFIPPPAPTPPTPHRHQSYICLFYILDCHDTFDDVDQWKTHVLSHFRTHAPPSTARCPLCPGERFDDAPTFTTSSEPSSLALSPLPSPSPSPSPSHSPSPSPSPSLLPSVSGHAHASNSTSVPSPAPSPPLSTTTSRPSTSYTSSSSSAHNTAWDQLLNHVDIAHYQQGQTLAGSRPDFELMRYLFRLRIISVEQFKAMQLLPPPSSPAYHTSQESVRRNIGSADEPYCAPYSRRREQRMRGQRRGVSVI